MAAPFGNKFAEGLENSGRPPKYANVSDISKRITEYFDLCQPTDEQRNVRPITITGLCLFLGFDSRQSFYDYEKKNEFTYTIKRARLVIESVYEEGLQDKFSTGSIFALKNMEWTDKQEIDHTINIPSLPNVIIKTND